MATQANREIAIDTPFGEDVVVLVGMSGREELGRLFEYHLTLQSDEAIDVDKILGEKVTIRLDVDDKERYFHGFVSRFAQTGRSQSHGIYEATIRPWLWFLTRRADCRIFQEMTVPEIIKKVFKRYDFAELEDALSGSYTPWTYCVQYRETDFNFVSRLMEQEGIYYFFKHEKGKHTLVLCDSQGAHSALTGNEEVPFRPPSDKDPEEHVFDWSNTQEVLPGKYSLQDYDFEKPSVDLTSQATMQRKHANSEYEYYDYPGEYIEEDDGKEYTKTRIEELQWQHEQISGAGTVRGFHPGGTFKLLDYPRDDQNREYLVISAQHDLRSAAFDSGEAASGPTCICGFTAIESKTPFRTPRMTPKPVMQGPQTAIVVGPSGEEIYTDKYGRVKVQFHWDREGKRDENSSCWIRVAQVWAGNAWGGIWIPRIGQEVMVEFLEGDPDQPIITGRVYNAEQVPPYSLPDHATQSGLKSRTTKGGGDLNFNEFRFEDKKGSEDIYLHAEKTWTIHVKDGESETVGSGISTNAGGSISRNTAADHSRTADKNINDKAGVNITTDSGKDMNLTAGGSYALFTNLGIQLKAMNFVAALIESSAKDAAEAVKKGDAGSALSAAKGKRGGGLSADLAGGGGGGGDPMAKAELAVQQTLAALSPGIEAGVAEIGKLSNKATEGMQNLEKPVGKAIAAMDAVKTAVEGGASPEVVAAAVMAMADAAMAAYKDAAAIVEGMLPQIPSITFWAMKNISATALWAIDMTAEVRNIEITAKNKHINMSAKKSFSVEAKDNDINLKAKQNVSLEASDKNLNVLAKTKDILITAKEKVSIKAEDKDLVIDAGKTRVIVTAKKQMVFKCGKASICLKEGGDVLIKGGKISIKGTDAIEAKGNPIKLN